MRILLLGIFVLGCGGGAQWAPLPKSMPTVEDYPDVDGVHLVDHTRVEFDLDHTSGEPYALVTTHRRTLVLRESGRRLGRVGVSYHPELLPLVSFEGQVVSPKRKVEPFDMEGANDRVAFGRGAYSDWRYCFVTRTVVPGSIVEVRYTQRIDDLRMFSVSHYLARDLPVKATRLEVSTPEGWATEHQVRRLNADLAEPPTTQQAAGRRVQAWSRADQAPILTERLSPPWYQLAPTVRLRLASWHTRAGEVHNLATPTEVSAYAHRLQADRTAVTPEIRARVEALLRGVPDEPRAKAQVLYDWVRQNVRYVAIELGMGGWVPTPAKDVFSTSYGDCKDKATLLSAMLDAAGIESRVATIHSHGGYPKRYGLPVVVGNANHAILVIDLPSGPVYADTTDRSVPFGRLPFRDQEADLLPASEGGSPLVKTPASGPEVNWTRVEAELKLGGDGKGRGGLTVTALGVPADVLRTRLAMETEKKRKKALRRAARVRGEVVDLRQVIEVEPTDADTPVVGKAKLELEMARSAGGWLISADGLLSGVAPQLPDKERRYPVVLGSRRALKQRIELSLPAGYVVRKLPDPVALESAFGVYALRWHQEGSKLVLDRTYETRERIVPPDAYGALRVFLGAAHRAEARRVVVMKEES